ncbi:MAG: B12-binding domain-containing radical SAM protein [Pygmaiobacter massiliensis]|nr:B12-binding domain-containing radical SAM protein [Pygmaiobacter massiliensis]
MRYFGRVFRPPSEAYSLILQATIGCSHNKCAFCSMYKEKTFTVRPVEQVLEDIDQARRTYPEIDRVFLADGDALILPMKSLLTILGHIKKVLPECERVGIYGSPRSITTKTQAELSQLQQAGLGIVYLGLESGNEAILRQMNKGETAVQIIEAGQKVRAAGLKLSVTVINGLGGTQRWEEHAVDTAHALSQMNPDYIGLLTLRVYRGTPLADMIERGEVIQPDPVQLMQETRLLLEQIDSEGSIFRSNHASNYLVLAGTLNRDRQAMIDKIDRALAGKERLRRYVELGF